MEAFDAFENNLGFGQMSTKRLTGAREAVSSMLFDEDVKPIAAAETGAAPERAWEPTAQEKLFLSSLRSEHGEEASQVTPDTQAAAARPWQTAEQRALTGQYMSDMMADYNAQSRQRVEQVGRMTASVTPEGRQKQKAAEMQARLAGAPVKLRGLVSDQATEGDIPAQGQKDEQTRSRRGPVVYDTVLQDGKQVTRWLMPDGSLTTNLGEAEREAYGARRARLMDEFVGRMRENGLDPAKEEDVEAQQRKDKLGVLESRVDDRLARNEKNIREIQDARSERFDESAKWDDNEGFWDNIARILGGSVRRSVETQHPVNRPAHTLTEEDKDLRVLTAENQVLAEARKLLDTRKLKKSDGFMGGFWNLRNNLRNMGMGAKHTLGDADFYAGGIMSLQKATELMAIEDKLKSGGKLSDREAEFVYSTMLGQDVAANADVPNGYTAAQVTVEMFPFMVQMATNPASGLSRALVRKYGKNGLKKVALTVAGDVAESAVLANTMQAPKVAADAMGRYQGDAVQDENGNISFDGSHNWASAIAKAEGAAVIENYTEMLGSHFGVITDKAGQLLGSGVRKLGGGQVVDGVSKLVTQVRSTDWAKAIGNIESRTRWSGSVGEVLEEEAGIVLNSMFVGDNKISDLWDADVQTDIVLGVGLFGGFVSGVKSAGYPFARAKAKSNLRKREQVAAYRFGEDWAPMREAIDQAEEPALNETVRTLIRERANSPEQARAIMEYAHSLMNARGFELAAASARAEGAITPEQQEAEESYNDGAEVFQQYSETTTEASSPGEAEAPVENAQEAAGAAMTEMQAISARFKAASEYCEEVFPEDTEMYMAQVRENPWGVLQDRTLTDDQREAVLYFINSKAALEGMLDASNEAAEQKREQVRMEVAHRVHQQRGVILPATLKVDDKPVYIVSGEVAMFPDGSGVDVERTKALNPTGVIYVLDESGEYRPVSADQIFSVSEAIDPESELNQAYEEINRGQEALVSAMSERPGEDTRADSSLRSEDSEAQAPAPVPAEELEAEAPPAEPEEVDFSLRSEHSEEPAAPVAAEGSALSLVPMNERGEPDLTHESVDAGTAWDATKEFFGDAEDALSYVQAEIKKAEDDVTMAEKAVSKVKPTGGMIKYRDDKAAARARVDAAKARHARWKAIEEAQARQKVDEEARIAAERAAQAENEHDDAVARFEEEQRVKAEQAAEQAAVGTHNVHPKIRERWEAAPKVEGEADVITLPDGSTISGRYVLTEAGAASASHDVNNAFAPTEGFPVDENGQSVNDRDYQRDGDAQQIVKTMADAYDSRALQSPVLVSKDGIVLSGNNRTMSGDMAAGQGTDAAYNEYLSKFGRKFGVTPEDVAKFQHPRVVFVPDEDIPYDAATFARFNAQEMKSQSKPEAAVKLGKVVSDDVFGSIVTDLSRYDRMSDFYADQEATARTLGALVEAGVINDKQLPELRTGDALSASGKELIENTLIGKAFQAEPDAVRMIISMPSMRQGVIMGLNEIAHNRTLAEKGYDLSAELSRAVKLVFDAKRSAPDIYKDGMPVSPFGRQQGLFDDEFGESRVSDGTTLLLADILNSGKPGDMRKILAMYNKEAAEGANGQMDLFTGDVANKEDILKSVNELFRNATSKEQQALLDTAIAERKRRAEEEQRGGGQGVEQTPNGTERGAESQQPAAGADDELTPEEQALAARVEVTDNDWAEGEGDKPTYKREIIIDGTHKATQIDAPDEGGHYTGSYFEFDGKRFGDIAEIAQYIDGGMKSEPTEAQKAAGNYKMEHRRVDGHNISIENPKGSVRRGTGADGKQWESTMQNDYGYIRGTEGVDGDHIDVFLSDTPEQGDVFVVDQVNKDGSFDEHKVMYGFPSVEAAREAYLSNYEQGWTGLGAITQVSKDEFKKWVQSSRRKTKPFAEYKGVKTVSNNPAASTTLYTVKPTHYTNKAGKTTPMHSIQFSTPPTYEQRKALAAFAREKADGKKSRGWCSDKDTYSEWLFRSEEDARRAGEMIADQSGEAVADAQPITAEELREAVAPINNVESKTPTKASKAKKAPINRVGLEDVMTDLSTKGETQFSNHAEPMVEPEVQHEISDDEMQSLANELRDLLGIGEDEGDADIKFRDPGELTPQERQRIQSAGIRLAMGLVERGTTSFPDYATKMVGLLGDKIRPWLKSFYEGARWTPGYENIAFTPSEEVARFDVQNFDKVQANPIEQAAMIVEEDKAAAASAQAQKELTEIRNNNRKKRDEQTAADTEIITKQAAAVAGKAENIAKTSEDPAELNRAGEEIDQTIEEINDQLALLGYYEAVKDDAKFHESYGYMLTAEKKAVADATALAKQLVKDLGIDLKVTSATTPLGRKSVKKDTAVRANIAPAGGDVIINLPLNEGRQLAIYIGLEPVAEKGSRRRGDNLAVEHIMYRVENPEGKGMERYGHNMYAPVKSTYADFLRRVKEITRNYLPEQMAEESHNGYKRGDEVMWDRYGNGKWEKVKIEDFDTDGSPIFESIKGIMSEKGDWSRIKPADGVFGEAKRVMTEAEAVRKKAQKPTDNDRKSRGKDVTLDANEPIGGLFADIFETPNSNGKKTDLQSRSSTAERERGHKPQSDEPLGASQRDEAERPDGRGMDRRDIGDTVYDAQRGRGLSLESAKSNLVEQLPESERKNVRNNHAERGVDYAPKGDDARIKANIEAIELAKRLLDAGETATSEQMEVLRKFSGWGGLGKAFNDNGNNPTTKRLRELLGEDGYNDAVMSRNSAYFTPAPVIDAMWDVARALGFNGGNVLEGSAGIGNILGLMPTDMSERSNIHAVEIDRTTGGILSLLYPDAQVDIQGFERTKVRNNSVDLAITNVPFVTGLHVKDDTGDKDLSKKFRNIHDFCIAKNIRKLREGGLGIFITSSGTMDNSKELRRWIINEGNADVIGAFRMHNKTFGGTGATSDIIVVRKRVNGKPSPNAIDVADVTGVRVVDYDTGDTRKVKGQEIPIIKPYSMTYNKYFAEHPENMAGEMLFNFERGETRFPTSRALFPSADKPQEKMLSEWAARFADMKEESSLRSDHDIAEEVTRINEKLGEGVKEGSMVLNSQGELCMARMGEAVPLGLNKNKVKGHTKAECFVDYTAIKKALSDVLEYQSTNEDNTGLEPLLKELNRAFDTFTKKYGNLHKNPAISFLRNDVDFSSIMALETYSERGDKKGNKVVKVGKTDIFSRRVIETEKEPQPTTIKDGILASLYKSGGIDVDYISDALGKSADEVKREIVKSGLGYENPASGIMEVSYKYLSGNVREKLHIAQENNEDGRYDANIAALEKVIPMTIPAHLIEFALGSSWIEPKLYEDFVYDKTGIRVRLTNVGGTWFMKTPWSTFNEKNRAMAVTSKICDKTIMGHELIEAAITNKQITVSKQIKHHDGTTETISDKGATAECSTKIDEIRSEFKDWARERMHADAEMSARIEETYNEQFNNYVPMSIPDEFVPQHFGGQVTELHGKPFALRPHQGRAVVRGTTEPILLAHEVGTGKTFTLITTAMEMRRLGTARKPMIVVQNATVGQFVESAKEIYPNAKVLTIEEADRTAEGRKNFYAKIKYNDWDMIVVPQSVFERIPDSPEREMAYIQDIIKEKMKVLEAMREADDDGRSMIVRQAEKELEEQRDRLAELTEAIEGKKKKRDEKKEATTRQNAEVRAMEMLDREVDDVENFDDMGIDAILVDEAHEYKHLGFATAMQRGVKGVDPSFSKKSQGVYLKTQAVMERNHGRNVVFATGTPISNTAAEIWTFMRYLMPADQMKAYDIFYFDDFVRNFGNLAQMVEFKTNGKFAEVSRFAGYVNLPELVRIWSGVADTVLTREAGGVSDKIPEMEGDKPTDIYLPQTRALRSVMKYVKAELERYDNMTGKEKKENSHIPLTMYGIAKAAAVDARLVIAGAEDDPNSKTNATVRETLRSLKDSAKYKGTVAIFSDNYQNKRSGFNLYEEIRNKLIAEGVPAEQIVVIKSGTTVKKKLDIFDKVNAGDVRVILGSTFTLGTGVNIQERLHTLIHVDAPNRPMDYTQRNGRAMRQGNLHKDMGIPVRIIRFGVEDSLDVTAYQRLKTKGAIADSIMNGSKMMQNSMENRVLEEEEDTFGDMTAQLSGSEYAILKNQAEREVRNLTAKQKGHDIDQIYVHNQLPKVEGFIKGAQRRIEIETKNLKIIGKHFPDGTLKKITIGKLSFDSVEGMEDFFKEQNAKMNEAAETIREGADNWTSRLTIDIDGLLFDVTTTVTREVDKSGQGTLSFELERNVTYSCEALGIKSRTVKGNRIKNVMQEIAERIVPGIESRELLSRGQNQLAHYSEDYRQLQERNGREFPFKQQLAEAKERLAQYEELMKKELEEKEAKYAEMDKAVDAATDITLDDDGEDAPTNGDGNKYREGEMSEGERLRAIRALKPIEVERNEMSRAELREEYNNLPNVVKDGREIEFYRSAFKKIYKDGGLFGQVIPVLDKVLEQSVLAYSEMDNLGGMVRPDGTVHKEHSNVISFDNYVGKVNIEGKECYVRTTVESGYDGRNGTHSFFVTGVDVYEKTADLNSSPGYPRATEASGKQSADGIVDAKLQQFFERAGLEANKIDMRERVDELADKLNTPVRIISDEAELSEPGEDGKPRYSRRERRAKGWWNSATDEVVVVLPNNVNVADVENTVVHEVVGHKGLRAFIGAERFGEFLSEVYNHASDSIRKRIDALTDKMVSAEADRRREKKRQARERAGEDYNATYYADMAEARVEAEQKREEYRREATEEYMADLAGRIGDDGFNRMSMDELTLWGKIKARVQAFLDKFLRGLNIPKSIRLTDKDLSYILFKSWKNAKGSSLRSEHGGGVFAEAEDTVMRHKTAWDAELDAKIKAEDELERVNSRFNSELQQQIDGTLPDGHIYRLGMPGTILRSTGVPVLPIQLNAARLKFKATAARHDFELSELKSIVCSLQNPIAVFSYGDSTKAQNIILEISHEGKNFVVGMALRPSVKGQVLEINSVRTVYPKDNHEWLKWVTDGKLLYVDKEKIQPILTQQRMNLADVEKIGLDLDDVAKVVNSFENPKYDEEAIIRFRDPEPGLEEYISRKKAEAAAKTGASVAQKHEALKAIADNLTKIHHKMVTRERWASRLRDDDKRAERLEEAGKIFEEKAGAQVEKGARVQMKYDAATAKSIKDLAMTLMNEGKLDLQGRSEINGVIRAITESVGKEDISEPVERLMDIMVENQLRRASDMYGTLFKVRGSKVNERGVEVQDELDPRGQMMLDAVRRLNKEKFVVTEDEDPFEAKMQEAEKLLDPEENHSALRRENAAIELAALHIARQYAKDIEGSLREEKELKRQLKEDEEDFKEGRISREELRTIQESTREWIRGSKLARIRAYHSLIEQLGGVMNESAERAQAWRQAEKERVEQIHHYANSDLHHIPYRESEMDETWRSKLSNNPVARIFLAPIATMEQVCRVIGEQSMDGNGYVKELVVDRWQEARDLEWRNTQKAERLLDREAQKVAGVKRWSDLYALTKKEAGTLKWRDGDDVIEHDVTQGNLMYIYQVGKMSDGRRLLALMGITDGEMAAVVSALDPKLREIADWLQEEYYPERRERYNAVHERMFGAPMAAIDNYVPLNVLQSTVQNKQELNGDNWKELPKTITKAVIRRVPHKHPIDIMGTDAVSLALDHTRDMETWAAMAEYRRDLTTLLRYNRFRSRLAHMTTIYGSGKEFNTRFDNLALLVAGAYHPKSSEFDKLARRITRFATGACIALRFNTAAKQLLSYPAFGGEAASKRLLQNMGRPGECLKFCLKNMPAMDRRWRERLAGNELLDDRGDDWKWEKKEFVKKLQRIGISPNAAVDLLTCCMGAEAVYHTQLEELTTAGFPKEVARKKALLEAEQVFNLSQQSSEVMYLSLMQNDRSYLTAAVSLFRTSPMSYTRQGIQATRELWNMRTEDARNKMIAFETTKALRDGILEGRSEAERRAAAEDYARKKLNRNKARNWVKAINFYFVLPALWTMGGALGWYALTGSDWDKKLDILGESAIRGCFGILEGVSCGGMLADVLYSLVMHKHLPGLDDTGLPFVNSLNDLIDTLVNDGDYVKAFNDAASFAIAGGLGINPQTLEDVIAAGIDHFGKDDMTLRDWCMFAMRAISVPQSQVDMVFFDDVELSAREAQGMTIDELAERYADFKLMHNEFATVFFYSDEFKAKRGERYREKVRKHAKGLLKQRNETEELRALLSEHEAEKERWSAVAALKEEDPDAYELAKVQLEYETDGAKYKRVNEYTRQMNKLTKQFLSTRDRDEAAELLKAMDRSRESLLEDISSGRYQERRRRRRQ